MFGVANGCKCTADIEDIRDFNFCVVAVPSRVVHDHKPTMTHQHNLTTAVWRVISKGAIVVSESTVYPGVTEYECTPEEERVSGWKFNTEKFSV